MFGRAIWDKLPECIFENFEITRVQNEGNFKIFKNHARDLSPKLPEPILYWNWYLLTVSKLQISERAITK